MGQYGRPQLATAGFLVIEPVRLSCAVLELSYSELFVKGRLF